MSWMESPAWRPAAAPDPGRDAGHVCLVGRAVSADWQLIAALKRRHQVTVSESASMLQSAALLRSVDVLALEASGPLRTADAVRMLHREQPGICIVLVGGGLTQDEIAEAFRAGAFDYFPNPEESDLLAERLHSLCNRYRRERSPLAGRTARKRTVVRQGGPDFVA